MLRGGVASSKQQEEQRQQQQQQQWRKEQQEEQQEKQQQQWRKEEQEEQLQQQRMMCSALSSEHTLPTSTAFPLGIEITLPLFLIVLVLLLIPLLPYFITAPAIYSHKLLHLQSRSIAESNDISHTSSVLVLALIERTCQFITFPELLLIRVMLLSFPLTCETLVRQAGVVKGVLSSYHTYIHHHLTCLLEAVLPESSRLLLWCRYCEGGAVLSAVRRPMDIVQMYFTQHFGHLGAQQSRLAVVVRH
jgi:hypothetical protein